MRVTKEGNDAGKKVRDEGRKNEPLVLFPHVVPLAQVDEVSHGLGGEQGEAVHDFDLSIPPK